MRVCMASVGALGLAACTTLGPMPAMSGTTPLPPDRTSVELEVAAVPGYFLSSSVQKDPRGAAIGQAAVAFELGRLLGAPGLTVGGRYVGSGEQGGYPEPMLGYRGFLGASRRWAAAVFAHGALGNGEDKSASYAVTLLGAEAAVDFRVTPESKWAEVHLAATASGVRLWADGTYCLDEAGVYGIDCPEIPVNMTDASASGLYPAGALSLAIDGGRHLGGIFHGARVAVHFAAGSMPRVEGGEQQSATGYAALGLSVALGLGAAAP